MCCKYIKRIVELYQAAHEKTFWNPFTVLLEFFLSDNFASFIYNCTLTNTNDTRTHRQKNTHKSWPVSVIHCVAVSVFSQCNGQQMVSSLCVCFVVFPEGCKVLISHRTYTACMTAVTQQFIQEGKWDRWQKSAELMFFVFVLPLIFE